ncbi:MAG: SbcC/MukB-like Walker B domain-containing protein, partial [Actinomyces bowdenii]|nr:SbcC/MukB-like Walker B domain-containing protein [Actinomyces bowdenii]
GPWPTVAARAGALLDQARRAEEASRAISAAATALDALQEALENLARALAEEGFTSAEQARECAMDAASRETLAQRVQEARTTRLRVAHALADPQIASLSGQEEDTLEQADEALAGAEAEHEAAAAQQARAAEAHAHLERACAGVEEAASAYEEAVGASAPLLRVAALARGDNSTGTTLATWVLQARFEEVLVFANERLSQMSCGRYELIRTDEESGSRARRKGLGLAVIDHLGAEHRRDPKTLSGGETFYVSLSLALALADVVSAESGGVSLDTLFIDEGFGSLDPETLQAVMTEIERLRAGGRSVGIVSHVEELKSQIPDQIRIRRSPAGGSTLAVTT